MYIFSIYRENNTEDKPNEDESNTVIEGENLKYYYIVQISEETKCKINPIEMAARNMSTSFWC